MGNNGESVGCKFGDRVSMCEKVVPLIPLSEMEAGFSYSKRSVLAKKLPPSYLLGTLWTPGKGCVIP